MAAHRKELEGVRRELLHAETTLEHSAEKPEQERANLEQSVDRKRRELQNAQEDAQAEAEAMRRRALREITDALDPILEDLAKKKKIGTVLSVPNPIVAYVSEELDLTDELMQAYDNATE